MEVVLYLLWVCFFSPAKGLYGCLEFLFVSGSCFANNIRLYVLIKVFIWIEVWTISWQQKQLYSLRRVSYPLLDCCSLMSRMPIGTHKDFLVREGPDYFLQKS